MDEINDISGFAGLERADETRPVAESLRRLEDGSAGFRGKRLGPSSQNEGNGRLRKAAPSCDVILFDAIGPELLKYHKQQDYTLVHRACDNGC